MTGWELAFWSGLTILVAFAMYRGYRAGYRWGLVFWAVLLCLGVGLIALGRWTIERDRRIVTQLRPLIDSCRAIGAADNLQVRGKVLLWNLLDDSPFPMMLNDSPHPASADLPLELKPGFFEEKLTVFMIVDRNVEDVGYYQWMDGNIETRTKVVGPPPINEEGEAFGGPLAGRWIWEICVAYWPEKKPVGRYLISWEPPPTIPLQYSWDQLDRGGHYMPSNEAVNLMIVDWVSRLPRDSPAKASESPHSAPAANID